MNIEEYQQQFLQLLHTGVVTFHYRKKDRSLRKAIGTTCLDLIPTDSLPKGIGCKRPEGYVNYYDFTVNGWRTLRLAHVTSYSLPSREEEHPTVGADPCVCPNKEEIASREIFQKSNSKSNKINGKLMDN